MCFVCFVRHLFALNLVVHNEHLIPYEKVELNVFDM